MSPSLSYESPSNPSDLPHPQGSRFSQPHPDLSLEIVASSTFFALTHITLDRFKCPRHPAPAGSGPQNNETGVLCGGLEPFIKNPTEWGIRNNDPEFQGVNAALQGVIHIGRLALTGRLARLTPGRNIDQLEKHTQLAYGEADRLLKGSLCFRPSNFEGCSTGRIRSVGVETAVSLMGPRAANKNKNKNALIRPTNITEKLGNAALFLTSIFSSSGNSMDELTLGKADPKYELIATPAFVLHESLPVNVDVALRMRPSMGSLLVHQFTIDSNDYYVSRVQHPLPILALTSRCLTPKFGVLRWQRMSNDDLSLNDLEPVAGKSASAPSCSVVHPLVINDAGHAGFDLQPLAGFVTALHTLNLQALRLLVHELISIRAAGARIRDWHAERRCCDHCTTHRRRQILARADWTKQSDMCFTHYVTARRISAQKNTRTSPPGETIRRGLCHPIAGKAQTRACPSHTGFRYIASFDGN
ncbi:hypothetical protein FA13DRAFT_1714471 [Coprinellus micaceus]|uniref:Uncharacterized protein n=1 Tax=Coprinellus micaceus TaxID=71717 RepID=A0A4Y7SRY7_COPMI|nr:hypothetical protein FA13DRAFT_1714471 [Coprinellus micaceus]